MADVENSADDEWVGPLPTEAVKPKKEKVLAHERTYIGNMPSSPAYETSYMHRDVLAFVTVSRHDFIISASVDGHVKFWKKCENQGIEFVKHFRTHLGKLVDLSLSANGEYVATISEDKNMKIFDVVNFDMINVITLDFVPYRCCFVYSSGDPITAIAVAEVNSGTIRVYDALRTDDPFYTDSQHRQPVSLIRFNTTFDTIVSADTSGMLEYWSSAKDEFSFPSAVKFEFKTDTDLYTFAQNKCRPLDLSFSPDGLLMASLATDRKVRIFRFLTGKLTKVYDESLQRFTEIQQMRQQVPTMEFGRRMALERELEKSDAWDRCNIIFDESGYFVLYGTMLGVKVINIKTDRCVKTLGKLENARFVNIAMFQGIAKPAGPAGTLTVEMEASDNPALHRSEADPTLFSTALKKNRFYLFTRREPNPDLDREIFNEKPTKEEIVSVTEDAAYSHVANSAVIHTTIGDIHIKLFPKECPKTVENFCVHARNGYYNKTIFHRVIKGFMIQTGDPLGNGTGGESIWGGEFEDEISPALRHDKPFTVSMANAGPNTNGSQFFITVVPTPWLDNKHTIFGRVEKGMDVALNISKLKVNPKNDKPYEDNEVAVVSITVK